ncbi:exodeoxyribonuclease V subunit alpha [Xanthomonas campestris pv. campestris]|uniref:exodeoxyribonuclease V subunit alpha n=1 Tax=Xanthomonas campestris TaxID=339 RepID=UPI001E612483|nr:exodeoxyribonuclease V subunit alpha [Xanthomonas campestris]MCD0254281.1 exodeoxyribonuclease V subunit alpha [Xanthomonas campestris pv. campestris]MDM7586470.1 exodeoxyribonuclease V subunit alpha [Xanthomonas campestris]MDM7591974.1 exodeoxyribonuclease V subunit alpha [Xanthomonas campestris]MEA9863723.1 exodeoxyribonuclease V subunit alpha [Xanthomonas campestris pv. raphani]MEB1262411.1 exodeoxyribonuclease V subunit alpha [Xanthomonas campestris pv. campestris]
MNHPNLLTALNQAGALRTLDLAFAQSLQRLAPDTDPQVLAGAALASLAVTSGHAGLDPTRAAMLLDAREGPSHALPDPTDWQRTLAASRWVDQPNPQEPAAADCPLVLEHGLLYLRRYREYERRLALGLQRIAAHSPPPFAAATLAPLFEQLFPQASPLPQGEGARRAGEGTGLPEPSIYQDGTNPPEPSHHQDHQAQAAALALRRTLLLVTGGPGTGKTTTIARLLLLRIAQAHASNTPAPRIALAAPTGRAAERMAESLRAAVARAIANGIDPALADALPTGASTLHRLLGVIPDSPQFRHTADNPLPFDLIVVDEASMVDLPLMCKLVEAVADGTQLILLGDADQLPSVEAGDVLAAILQAAGPGDTLQPQDADALQPLLGSAPPGSTPASIQTGGHTISHTHTGGLAGHRVHLLRGYRQADNFALTPLADAIRTSDADTALALLRSGELAGVHFHEDGEDPLALGRDALLAHWRALADAHDPAAALRDAARLRLLTAVRAGPQGARGLNARIEQLLAESGSGARRLGSASPWFQGRLLLITENSYRHGLFNGDVGICLRSEASPFSERSDTNAPSERSDASTVTARSDAAASSGPSHSIGTANRADPVAERRAQGPLVAWFEGDGDGQVRGFHPAALPAHESAFAMTVHKAQGSEFDTVWLQLPTRDARVLSRELLYTGITRARRALHLAGSEAVLRAALARHAARISGLAWRLGGEQQAAPAKPATEPSTALPVQGSLF